MFLFLLLSVAAQAQIGYQVTLLNTATGEPRANERVNMTVVITNSAGTTICSENKSATTNDFGILSVAVGNADTFANADWSKLPFFISATVDNVMIGKSQLLSVPVAEHAKHTGSLTVEKLSGSWYHNDSSISFGTSGRYSRGNGNGGTYEIDGNCVITSDGYVYHYSPKNDILVQVDGRVVYSR